MIQVDWSLLVAAAIFLITLFALNRVLFRPMAEVIHERQARTTDSFARTEEVRDYARALLDEYEQKVKEGRQSGYRLGEAARAETLRLRQEKIRRVKEEAEALLRESSSAIEEELESARKNLRGEAEEIASLISSRFLGR